jgi:preprotein translocase subunit SecA
MAGRGTDILLGGNAEYLAKAKLIQDGVSNEVIERVTAYNVELTDEEKEIKAKYQALLTDYEKETAEEREKVLKLGGLHILGTERHESRRIDNQLRGRAGRQGDPGSSIFFISLEDELPQRFGEDRMKNMFSIIFRGNEDMPIQMGILTKFFERAQKKTEGVNFGIRKQVLEYDDVLNKQRTIIYGERDKVLDGTDVHEQVVEMLHDYIKTICLDYIDDTKPSYEWDLETLNKALEDKLFEKGSNIVTKELVADTDVNQASEKIFEKAKEIYEAKVNEIKKIGIDFAQIERAIMLRVVDKFWMDHIDAMNVLRNEIGVLSYGQKDPIIAYKNEGFDMFDNMIDQIREYTASSLFRMKIRIDIKVPQRAPIPTNSGKPEGQPQGPFAPQQKGPFMPANNPTSPVKAESSTKVDRNDQCPCGSGKKYKNCCGKDA